ncbi:MAG TPA: hypothetical protein VEP67_12525 [Thiobacillaceae bacterium]|nr:hypothetical protein [Thiobacillaceae bacterium]
MTTQSHPSAESRPIHRPPLTPAALLVVPALFLTPVAHLSTLASLLNPAALLSILASLLILAILLVIPLAFLAIRLPCHPCPRLFRL